MEDQLTQQLLERLEAGRIAATATPEPADLADTFAQFFLNNTTY